VDDGSGRAFEGRLASYSPTPGIPYSRYAQSLRGHLRSNLSVRATEMRNDGLSQRKMLGDRVALHRCPFPAGLWPAAHLRLTPAGKASFPRHSPAQRARVADAGRNGQLEGAGTRALPPTLLRSADGSGPSPLSDFTARHLDVQKYDSVPNRSSFADRAHSRRNAAFQAIMDRPKVHARAGLRRSSIAGSYSITWSLDHRATARTRH